jgi:hypothetical protein
MVAIRRDMADLLGRSCGRCFINVEETTK